MSDDLLPGEGPPEPSQGPGRDEATEGAAEADVQAALEAAEKAQAESLALAVGDILADRALDPAELQPPDESALEGGEIALEDEPLPGLEDEAPTRRADHRPPAVQVDHVADAAHHYPGEEVVWLTRVTVLRDCAGFVLRVSLPPVARLLGAHAQASVLLYATETHDGDSWLRWAVEAPLKAGMRYDFETMLRVPPVEEMVSPPEEAYSGGQPVLLSRAEAVALAADDDGGGALAPVSETSVVLIRGKGRYLNYLPALYERDGFMGRFLMLFESFWGPINQQADSIEHYFDPGLMPIEMVHWFAARFDLAIEDDWPPESKRRLLASAIRLFRRRGTRAGLQEMLEIYSGGKVTILERRANNFRLGGAALLGHGVALGSANRPHSFGVSVELPAIPDDPYRPEESERLRSARRSRLNAIINAEKPAHVTYTLDIQEE